MRVSDLLVDAFGRISEGVDAVVDGLDADQLAYRTAGAGNSIAWLVWHLTRVQDDHVSDAAGMEQAWTAAGWAEQLGLPFDSAATGYGQPPDEAAQVRVASGTSLLAYHHTVHQRTVRFVSGLEDDDLDRIVDESFTPPVTLGVRLVSVIADDLQHVGQAAYVRGLLPGT